jgi:hypothetical protein
MDDGGFVQIIPGKSPIGIPVPSVQVAPGGMLVLIPDQVATRIRPTVRQLRASAVKGLVGGDGLPS